MKTKSDVLLWNLLWGCISRDEIFGGNESEEYADSLIRAFKYFFPNEIVHYMDQLIVNHEIMTLDRLEEYNKKRGEGI